MDKNNNYGKGKCHGNGKYILGVDPGINNLGWVITRLNGSIYKWGLVTKTLEDLKSPEDLARFRKNMRYLVKTLNSMYKKTGCKPDFIMERYMPRGMRRGNQTERINILIGYLFAKVKMRNMYMVPASSWKNYRQKHYFEVSNTTVPDHMVDTYTMTLYCLEHLQGKLSENKVKSLLRKVDNKDWGWKKKKGVWVQDV